MPNKKYLKGYRTERKCRKELEEAGYYTFRSGGSKSPIDVIGIDLNGVRLIQVKCVKTNHTSSTVYDKNLEKLAHMKVPVNCRKELWVWREKGNTWRKEVINEYD